MNLWQRIKDLLAVAPTPMTQAEATAKAIRLWGPRAFAHEDIECNAVAVGCGETTYGFGPTWEAAFLQAKANGH